VLFQVLAATLLGSVTTLIPSSTFATSFEEVAAWCASKDEGDQRLCDNYWGWAVELLRNPDPVSNGGHQVCVPPGDPRKTVFPIVSTWIKEHPESNGELAINQVSEALADRYPCK
jgi:hypothetical protein